MYLGVRVIMAKSFERIHSANLINFGIIPLVFKNESDYERINTGDSFTASGLIGQVAKGNDVSVEIAGAEYLFTLLASERQRKILVDGGLLNFTRKNIS